MPSKFFYSTCNQLCSKAMAGLSLKNVVNLQSAHLVTLFCQIVISQVNGTVEEIKSEEDQSITEKINLHCQYSNAKFGYTCYLSDMDIQNENTEVTYFTGTHIDAKTDLDVERIVFMDGRMAYLPNGIGLIFNNLENVRVNHNLNFTHPKRSNFKYLGNLIKIFFSGNNIETLDEDFLWDLQSLEMLNLSKNRLKTLHERTFEKNTELRILYLGNNEIEKFAENILWNLQNLEIFSIFKNKLQTLHEKTFEKNTNLIELYLSQNVIETINEKSFWELQNLEKITLSHNNITILSERIFEKNTQLTDVWLGDNGIETFHENTLRNLPNLKIFQLCRNKIRFLYEKTFDENTQLRVVDLDENQLESLPKNLFKNNLLLEEVRFSENLLIEIQTDFSQIINIIKLYFYDNICIHAYYGKDNNYTKPQYMNLTDIQSVMKINCTAIL